MAAERGYKIPVVDLAGETQRQFLVDREPGQYLGHPTTVLLDDNKTILCVYPKGHGKGPVVYKRSTDGGKTWSQRLPTPPNWTTSGECPTLFRLMDPVSFGSLGYALRHTHSTFHHASRKRWLCTNGHAI